MSESEKDTAIQISVVIPAYNIEQYIERAINSVLAQTRPADEILVVDDGSKDATAEKVKAYGDKVRYIYQDNRGLSGARNTGIRESNYDWVAFLDGDDEWLPDYLRLQTTILEQNPELKWSTGNFVCCLCEEDRRGAHIDPKKAKQRLGGRPYASNYFESLTCGLTGNADTTVIYKQIFQEVGFFNEQQAFAEDHEMWWRIAFQYPSIGYVAEPIAVYHLQRPGTLTEEFKEKRISWLIELVEKNFSRAADSNMQESFTRFVGFFVTSWVRGLLFENNPVLVGDLLNRFGKYMNKRFVLFVRVLMLCPKGTAWACHTISRVVRKLKLRRKIVRPPSAPR